MFGSRRRHHEPTYLSPADVARHIGRSPSRISRYISDKAMPDPDATTAGGQPLWYPSTIDMWWLDRSPATNDTPDTPRWLRPIQPSGIQPELIEERIADVSHRYANEPHNVHLRIYRAVDSGTPLAIVENMSTNIRTPIPLEPLRAAATTDLDRADPMWIRISTWVDHWGEEWGRQPGLEIDLWTHNRGGWTPADTEPHPITTAAIARLIGQPLPIYPRELLTAETIAASAKTPAGQPVSVLTDPRHIAQSLAHLDAITTAPSYNDDPALQYAAGVIATQTARHDDDLHSTRELPHYERRPLPAGTRRGAVAVPRTLLPPERSHVLEHRFDPPPRTDTYTATDTVTTIAEPVVPTLRRLRRTYLNDAHLPAPLREALTIAVDDLASAYRATQPDTARKEAPLIIRRHTYDPTHWLIPAYLETAYRPIDHDQIPDTLAHRAHQLSDFENSYHDHENPRWWIRTDWTPEPTDDVPDQPALAYAHEDTYELKDWGGTNRPTGPTTRYHLQLEWPPLRTPGVDVSSYAAAHLVAPPASPSVHRPVFLHDPTTGNLTPFPSDGRDGPAWGVSSTDMLTPDVLHWLGHDDYEVRRDHPETYEQLRWMLWGSGSAELNQPLPAITALLDTT